MLSFASLLALTTLFCALIPLLRHLQRLHQNYQSAKLTGLHLIIMPLDPYGTTWQLLSNLCGPFLHPFEWCRISFASWAWQAGATHHTKYGENFLVVTPARNILHTSDKATIEEVLKKIKTWIKPPLYEALDFYGRNVDTVNGEDWSRHRKITAPCFNERVSGLVWDETVRQATAMLEHWLAQPGGEVSRMVDDTRVVALHVLYAAGFGVQHDFLGGVRNPAAGHELSHRDALMTLLNNFITTIVVAPQEGFFNAIAGVLSKRVRRILLAIREFRQYTEEAIAREREVMREGGVAAAGEKPNLMSTLIRTSDGARREGKGVAQLSDEEIRGNIFIFNIAGHDTTANTLAYAFALLAIHPEVQEWVGEEIDEVLGGKDAPVYEETHPRLKRVLAVMYETLRLYGPVPQIPRATSTPSLPVPLTTTSTTSSSSSILLPPNTDISLNLHAMHLTPTTFPSPSTWNPSRWISSPSSPSSSPSLKDESFLPREQGFAAWASGPRVCPGMKFSQVEFTGTLSAVLRRARVGPGVERDEDEEGARRRLEGLVRDSWLIGATMSMRRPGEVRLKVVRREA